MENRQEPIQQRFLEEVNKLKLRFPVAKISKATGYKSPIVSEYLSGKKVISEKFLKTFCEAFNIDYAAVAEEPQQEPQADTLRFPDFIRAYRKRGGERMHAIVAMQTLADILGAGITSDNVNKWEIRGTIPHLYKHQKAIKAFFKIDDLEVIPKELLDEAIACYPNPVGIVAEKRAVNKRIPVIGEAIAGTEMEMNVNDNPHIDEYIDVGDMLRDSEAAFTVYGNSMTPAYPPGVLLGIKRNMDSFIQPGETYLLLTKSNRVFKRLFYTEDKSGFLCYSDNTMKYDSGPLSGKYSYPPFEVPFSEVISIFDITGMIKRNRNSGIINRQK